MSICQTISEQLGSLFTCSEVSGETRIATPFLYPDGDVIDIYYRKSNDDYIFTDHGEALRWLWSQTVAAKRTNRQNRLIEDVCQTHALDVSQGVISTRVLTSENVASAVMRISQGVLRISDLWVTSRT